MKKIISLSVAALLITNVTTTVFAYGHGRGHSSIRTVAVKYSVCAVQNCSTTGLHTHDGLTYAAHYYSDGHDYHDYCAVANCALTGYHEHDGAYCFAHTSNDGHGHDGGFHH